ncbi:efflux RND transporter periplasmic adaptor subunit [Photobacterium lucens]|uniref:efflux RND transporter periplasmic adaptor subunit n=1 Tax=Photobacterium lucens TaxID=2562949 RepID=UPI00136B60E3|nr:efflux RND transporter periplasmic adaptor subunit [Photobacterium lucens]MBP2701865.1 efflux RND transporter periplasmic adaptor subunit [Vibrio parahaemolyticus]MZG55564.1 efflux RND transporter periplasmic adaptor subunit [Photobacterium lucens]MZG81793.1 efflux RND transporter periplasmic adaptor subunit [Photobacterium lucens]
MHVIVRRTLPLVIIAIFIALSVLLLNNKKRPEQQKVQVRTPVLEVIRIEKQDVQLSVDSYGVVEPKYKAEVVSEVIGSVNYISPDFAVGKFVSKGELLARLDDSDYHADLAQAEASLAQAQAKLKEEIARGKVAKKTLRDVSPNKKTALGLREPQRKQEEANVKFAKAGVERAKRSLAKTEIRAPFDALVKMKNINMGSYLTQGKLIGELYGTETAEIRLPITPNSFSYLDLNRLDSRKLNIEAQYGDIQINHWAAKLVRNEGIIDKDNRMIYLIAEVDDPYNLKSPLDKSSIKSISSLSTSSPSLTLPVLQFGTFVTTTIQGKKVKDVIKLPRHVVRSEQVIVVDSQNKTQTRQVNVVRSDNENAYVIGGLEDGEFVSLIRSDSLIDGTEVKTVMSQSYTPEIAPLMAAEPKVVNAGESP